MLFWRKKKAGPSVRDSLASKPIRMIEPDIEETKDGGARLKVRLRSTRWTRFFRLPEGSSKSFEMDAIGMLVWNACDGKTSVQQIIRKLAARYNLNLREAEVSTQVFLRTLIKKGLIGIPVKKPKGKED